MAVQPSSSAVRALALEYKSIQEEPVEGFRVKLINDDVLFEWEVAIFGPPETLYRGGYFKVNLCYFTEYSYWTVELTHFVSVSLKAQMKFPPDYPYSPPSMRFLTKVWHPNVYEVSSFPLLALWGF